jgi:ubiquinone/menaquinone biosynthesis C-methylase UbiE
MKILDVGSGNEIPFAPAAHDVIHIDLEPGSFCLELLADGFNLPFPDEVFDVVHCSHVLEHVNNPWAFLKELKRVSRRAVVVKVPNVGFYKLFSNSPHHIFGWSQFNFRNLLKKIFPKVVVYGGWRIPNTKQGILKKMETIKVYGMSLIMGSNELIGVCWI